MQRLRVLGILSFYYKVLAQWNTVTRRLAGRHFPPSRLASIFNPGPFTPSPSRFAPYMYYKICGDF